MFFAISSFVFAVKPSSSTISTDALIVTNPVLEYYKLGENISLHFHVFNTTGVTQNSTNLTCQIHIYDSDSHIVKSSLLFDGPSDYEIALNMSLFNKVGQYPYTMYCQNKGVGGAVVDSFIITEDGETPHDYNTMFYIISLAISILTLILGIYLESTIMSILGGFLIMILGIVAISFGINFIFFIIPIIVGVFIITSVKLE
jgi:hypothetical protein